MKDSRRAVRATRGSPRPRSLGIFNRHIQAVPPHASTPRRIRRGGRRLAPVHATPRRDRMRSLASLFENNRRWAARMTAAEPDFFERLAAHQTPQYLWIGCSDSRVPPNELVSLMPGE